jgi:hypothetical protein
MTATSKETRNRLVDRGLAFVDERDQAKIIKLHDDSFAWQPRPAAIL